MPDLAIFLPACFALNLAFGPSNLVAMTHAATVGPGFAIRAGFGRLLVFAPMIALSAAGLGLLLAASAAAFTVLKLAGAAYLIWLGIRILRSRGPATGLVTAAPPSFRTAFLREMATAASNPKAMLIFAAFFPQFAVPDAYWQSYAVMGGIFLAFEWVVIGLYAGLAAVMARSATPRLGLVQRTSGATMVIFGALMLLARRPGVA